MAATVYFNNTNELNSLWYDSHASVVKRVCMELGQTDNMNEVVEKILGPRPKVKKMKDPNKPKKRQRLLLCFIVMIIALILWRHRRKRLERLLLVRLLRN